MFVLKKFFLLKIFNEERVLERFFSLLIIISIPINLAWNRMYDATWTVGEWLISYRGGFVRRGLPGEIIYQISNNFNIPPVLLIHIFSSLSLIALSLILINFSRGLFNKSLLLSQLMIMGPLAGNYFVRKDTFLIVLYAFCLIILKIFYEKKINQIILTLGINLISIIAILSHEMYGIWGLPSLFLIIFFIFKERKNTLLTSISKAFFMISPSLISFWLCWVFKGVPIMALRIHQNWQSLENLISHGGALDVFSPDDLPQKGAIAAIGWGKSQVFSTQILDDFSIGIIWHPAIWLLTIFVIMQLFIGSKNDFFRKIKRIIICIQFIPIIPMFLMVDFGRWLFIWVTTSALLIGFINKTLGVESFYERMTKLYNYKLISKITPGFASKKIYNIFLLFTGITGSWWSINDFLNSTPIGFLIYNIYMYFKGFFKVLF